VNPIRRRLAAAGTIVALAGLAGAAYAAGDGSQPTPPAMVASTQGGHAAALSTRASGTAVTSKHRNAPRARGAVAKPAPLATRASANGQQRGGEREGNDDAVGARADA